MESLGKILRNAARSELVDRMWSCIVSVRSLRLELVGSDSIVGVRCRHMPIQKVKRIAAGSHN